jgi:chemotaxis protein methyltransferase CheR
LNVFGFIKKGSDNRNNPLKVEQEKDFSDEHLLIKFIKENTGINFENQHAIFKSKLTSFCQQRNINSFNACLNRAVEDSHFKQELFNYFTTNETYFFREFQQIETLVAQVVSRHDVVEIMCIPCSTGEEPYSISLALQEAGVPVDRFNILGLDIDTGAICRAKLGKFKQRSISTLPVSLVDKYFSCRDGYYYLNDDIKTSVSFMAINLFDPAFSKLGEFDYVFSRNMLIYFDKKTKLKAKTILNGVLKNKAAGVYYGHADLY